MPTIKTTTMLGTGNIAADRITINNNFELVAGALNDLQNYIDIDNKVLKGLSSVSVYKGAEATATPNDFLINTNGSMSVLGSAIVGGAVQANTGRFANGLEVTKGDINIPNANTNLNLSGNMNLGGELVLGDFGLDGYIIANSKIYFNLAATGGESLLLTDPNTSSVIGGKVSLKGRNSVILDWRTYSGANLDLSLWKVMLMTTGVIAGQVVEIMALVPDGFDFYIDSSTFKYPGYTATQAVLSGIKFTASYQSIRVMFDGSNWVVLNITGAVLV